MANNAILCIDNITPIDVNFNGLNIGVGSVVSAWDTLTDPDTAQRNCVTLTSNTDEPLGSVTAVTEYNNCYECFVNNYYTVTIEFCDGGEYQVDIVDFGTIPTTGDVYFLELTTTGETIVGCFTIGDITPNNKETYDVLDLSTAKLLATAPFPSCEICQNGFSAGTESESCQICWDGSGYTATVVSVPHPRWTNQFGQTVIQLDAITLGGQNGLNN